MPDRTSAPLVISNDDLSPQVRELRYLREQFDRCWPWLESASDGAVQHDAATVWARIVNLQAHFWPLPNAAVVTAISQYPNGDKEMQVWLAGGDLQEVQSLLPELEAWGRERECRRFLILAPRDWSLAFQGFRTQATLLTKEL